MKFQLLNLFAWLGNIRRAPSSVPNPPIMATKNPGRGHLPRRTWAIVRDGSGWRFRNDESAPSQPGPGRRAAMKAQGLSRRLFIKIRKDERRVARAFADQPIGGAK